MRILVTCAGFPPAYLGGGPIRTIAAMCEHASPLHEVLVATNNYDHGSTDPLVSDAGYWKQFGSAQVLYLDPGPIALVSGLRRAIARNPDAIYLNGLFYLRLSITLQLLSKVSGSRKVLAIAPRGELDPGALSLKSRKKQWFLKTMKVAGIFRDVIWHASSALEAQNIRIAIGSNARIIVRENDTLLPAMATVPEHVSAGPLSLAFLSRISPKKGLHIALQALRHVKHPVRFDIIGPLEDPTYVAECKKLARELPPNVSTTFIGHVGPAEVRQTLSNYDLMVLPTAGENFGHVIAESLSVGCPVMVSNTTPWTERIRRGGGIVMDVLDAEQWAAALSTCAAVGPEEWFERRTRSTSVYDEWRSESHDTHFFRSPRAGNPVIGEIVF